MEIGDKVKCIESFIGDDGKSYYSKGMVFDVTKENTPFFYAYSDKFMIMVDETTLKYIHDDFDLIGFPFLIPIKELKKEKTFIEKLDERISKNKKQEKIDFYDFYKFMCNNKKTFFDVMIKKFEEKFNIDIPENIKNKEAFYKYIVQNHLK